MTIGSMIRTRSLDNLWKIKVHAPSLFSYWLGNFFVFFYFFGSFIYLFLFINLGAVIGCFTYVAWAERALYVNATATIAFGIYFFFLIHAKLKIYFYLFFVLNL